MPAMARREAVRPGPGVPGPRWRPPPMTPVSRPVPPALVRCAGPVFVIGAPRSGTTALGRALGHHGQFYAGDETLFMTELFGNRRTEGVHERWAGRPSSSWLRRENVSLDDFLEALGAGIDALFTRAAGGRRWVDHTPAYARIAPTLGRLFPHASFLHILRDGREVVNSMINISRTLPGDVAEQMKQKGFLPDWGRDFRVACASWRDTVRAAADYAREQPHRCRVVWHRELEADPVTTLAEVFRFLGAPDDPAPAHFLRTNRFNTSFTGPDGPGPVRPDAYRRPDPWSEWSDEQRAIFMEVAGPEMQNQGFPLPGDRASASNASSGEGD
ncbi:MAG: sulfotransferase [Planctomycetia bacterium]|nr:sulfotransferase [Planctomycetia bacterium]